MNGRLTDRAALTQNLGGYNMSKRVVTVGGVHIGAGSPVTIQSMCSVPFSRFDELASQALRLQEEGCDILRVSVPDRESADRFA